MTPEAALEMQIDCYRRMTGEDRLRIALDLHAMALDLSRQGIRWQFPGAEDDEVERRLHERLARVTGR